jgi:hypothetical protein
LADLGKSILGILDIDADLSFGDGNLAFAHDEARRLCTEPGGLMDDPAYGYGLQLLLSSTIDGPSVERKIEQQLLQDERALEADATVIADSEQKTVSVPIALETADGPFEFTLNVSQLSVELLLPEANQ